MWLSVLFSFVSSKIKKSRKEEKKNENINVIQPKQCENVRVNNTNNRQQQKKNEPKKNQKKKIKRKYQIPPIKL